MNQRIYKPYHQYISEAEKLSDDEFYKLIDEIESVCCSRLQIEEYIKKHNNKWNSVGTTVEGNQMVKILDKNRLNALIELCSFVNKVTKTIDIESALESGQISDKIQNVTDVEFTKEEIKKIQKWELKDTEKRYIDIFNRLKSQSDKDRKKGMKQLCELSDKELSEYENVRGFIEDEKYFYKLKQNILTEIIYELRTNPDKYPGYQYGFIEDQTEDDKVLCEFAINIPGHLGTYQFHILRREDRDVIYNINSLYEVKHKFAGLVKGDRSISQMNWIYTEDDIKDIQKIEQQYNKIKKRLQGSSKIEDDDYRRLYMLAMLLRKDPETELESIKKEASIYYENESDSFTKDEGKKSRRLVEQKQGIIQNLKANRKIYVASGDIFDTKAAIESIIREAEQEGIDRKKIEIIKVEPGIQEISGGIYLNVNKEGIVIDKKNQNGMLFISSQESIREPSVCSVLSRLGFNIPTNVIKYASKVMPEISKNPRNAYLLMNDLDGATILDFCKELDEKEEELFDVSLTEDNMEKYTSLTEERKKILNSKAERNKIIFEEVEKNLKYYSVGEKKIGICINPPEYGLYSAYFAYANGADYCISITDEDRGIQCAIQSNPQKCDLPIELEQWAYKKILEEPNIKDIGDVLVQKTRIIIGGKTKPDVFLENKEGKINKNFTREVLDSIIDKIAKSENLESQEMQDLFLQIHQEYNLQDIERNKNEIEVSNQENKTRKDSEQKSSKQNLEEATDEKVETKKNLLLNYVSKIINKLKDAVKRKKIKMLPEGSQNKKEEIGIKHDERNTFIKDIRVSPEEMKENIGEEQTENTQIKHDKKESPSLDD